MPTPDAQLLEATLDVVAVAIAATIQVLKTIRSTTPTVNHLPNLTLAITQPMKSGEMSNEADHCFDRYR